MSRLDSFEIKFVISCFEYIFSLELLWKHVIQNRGVFFWKENNEICLSWSNFWFMMRIRSPCLVPDEI